jgi:molybdopterin converting factor small subunit
MSRVKKIKVRKLGPEGHSVSALTIHDAFRELSDAIKNGYFLYVEPWNHIISDIDKLRNEISKIESVIIIPAVTGG